MKTLHRSHKRLWIEALIWVAAEVVLNLVGLDDLADYGEFVLNTREKVSITQINVVTPV
jgi:hypothetical protein